MSRPGPEVRRSKFLIVVYARQAAAGLARSRRAWPAISGNRNERIDDPTSQLSSAYCKASRSVDWAFGSAICRANPLGYQNLLFPVYRARTVFVLYGLTIRSLFSFLYHTRRDSAYVWIAYLAWSVFICSILSVFAIEYDLLPHTPELYRRPLIDYLCYEIITFTTVGYAT
jgi:hypothetical protein